MGEWELWSGWGCGQEDAMEQQETFYWNVLSLGTTLRSTSSISWGHQVSRPNPFTLTRFSILGRVGGAILGRSQVAPPSLVLSPRRHSSSYCRLGASLQKSNQDEKNYHVLFYKCLIFYPFLSALNVEIPNHLPCPRQHSRKARKRSGSPLGEIGR